MDRFTRRMVILAALAGLSWNMLQPGSAPGHCQIPCGIYDDGMRIKMMREDVTTVEKAMRQIAALTAQPRLDYNQVVRWIENKEHHAGRIQEIATQYFMAQRIKPIDSKDSGAYRVYVHKLTLLHRIVVQAMKCKQTTDLAHVEALRALLKEFEAACLGH